MWQPGWEESLGENGHMCMYGWAPSLLTTLLSHHYHNIVSWLYPNNKFNTCQKRKERRKTSPQCLKRCLWFPRQAQENREGQAGISRGIQTWVWKEPMWHSAQWVKCFNRLEPAGRLERKGKWKVATGKGRLGVTGPDLPGWRGSPGGHRNNPRKQGWARRQQRGQQDRAVRSGDRRAA